MLYQKHLHVHVASSNAEYMSITQRCVLLLYWNMMLPVVVNHTIAVMVASNNWLSLMYDSDKYHSILGVTVRAQLCSTCHQTNTTCSEMSIVSNIITNMQIACKRQTWIVITTIMSDKLSLWPKVTDILNWSSVSIYAVSFWSEWLVVILSF